MSNAEYDVIDLGKAKHRLRRAERTRARALSPRRILGLLISLPVIAASTAMALYLRTSDLEPELALRHLVAGVSCDMAFRVGLAPSRAGDPGYHPRTDPDQNGIACEAPAPASDTPGDGASRIVGGAKFVRP